MKKAVIIILTIIVLIGVVIGLNTVEYTVDTIGDGFVLMTVDGNEDYTVEFEKTEQDIKVGDKFYGIHKVPFLTVIWGYDGNYVPDER